MYNHQTLVNSLQGRRPFSDALLALPANRKICSVEFGVAETASVRIGHRPQILETLVISGAISLESHMCNDEVRFGDTVGKPQPAYVIFLDDHQSYGTDFD